MPKTSYIVLALITGIIFALQASVNGALGKRIGVFEGSFLSALITALILSVIVLIFGKGTMLEFIHVPKWQLLGGLLGAFIVASMVITVPNIGVASAVFAVIFGQMIISVVIDHFGLFNVPVIKFDFYRLTGIVLMLSGVILILKGNFTSG